MTESDGGPRKLFVETTSRCNIQCAMCVKQSDGCGIVDGDMTTEIFSALKPALKGAETLILNGIGEPLLHPELEGFIAEARSIMPPESVIGFQTNGMLLTEKRMTRLAEAGLDIISFSLDVADPALFGSIREGGEFQGISEALDICSAVRRRNGMRRFRVGIEAVLQRDTMEKLPETLRWAAGHGADFALVSHILAYDESMAAQAVFDRCTDEAVNHYLKWKALADERKLSFDDYYSVRWKYHKTDYEQELADLVDSMTKEAYDQGLYFHLKNHLERDDALQVRLARVMDDCRRAAVETGLELTLPATVPSSSRRCDFMEDKGTFISWEGKVHPCYFLWHSYTCHVTDWKKYVSAKSFGSVLEQPILNIWNSPEYSEFRRVAEGYDYPFCTNCTVAPCDYIDTPDFEQDCYTNTVPCADCQWCLGLFQCLR